MTAYELIQLLRRHSPGLRVVVDGYEDGYDDLSPEQISGRGVEPPSCGMPLTSSAPTKHPTDGSRYAVLTASPTTTPDRSQRRR